MSYVAAGDVLAGSDADAAGAAAGGASVAGAGVSPAAADAAVAPPPPPPPELPTGGDEDVAPPASAAPSPSPSCNDAGGDGEASTGDDVLPGPAAPGGSQGACVSPLQDQALTSPPFTDSVQDAITDLRRGLAEAEASLPDGEARKLQAQADAVVSVFEQQVLLMFRNWNVHKADQAGHLRKADMDTVNRLRAEMGSPYEGLPGPGIAIPDSTSHPSHPHTLLQGLNVGPSPLRGLAGSGDDTQEVAAAAAAAAAATVASAAPQPSGGNGVRGAAGGGGGGGRADLRRGAAVALHLHLSALATRVQAQQAVLYLYDKTTATLRSACSVPPGVSVTVPAHLGVQGAVFHSSVAFNLGGVEDEAQPLVKSADLQAGRVTHTILAFPLVSGTQRGALGLVEVVNKRGGAKWTAADEAVAYHASSTLYHIVRQLPQELVASLDSASPVPGVGCLAAAAAAAASGGVADDVVDGAAGCGDAGGEAAAASGGGKQAKQQRRREAGRAGRKVPAAAAAAAADAGPAEDEGGEGGGGGAAADAASDLRREVGQLAVGSVAQTSRTQLVFRPERGQKVDTANVKGAPLTDTNNVKELHSYLQTLEESYRRGLNQYVLVDSEKREVLLEVGKKTQRIRVLEENITYLTKQNSVLQSRSSLPAGGIPPGHAPNYHNYTDGAYEEQERSQQQQQQQQQPSQGSAQGAGGPPPLWTTALAADHPTEVREKIEIAQRLATVINAPPPVTTALPSGTDHRLLPVKNKVAAKGRPYAAAALSELRRQRYATHTHTHTPQP